MRHDLLDVDRLGQEVVGAGLDRTQLHLDGLLREDHERDGFPVGALLDLPAEVKPIGAAFETSLRDDQVRPLSLDGGERLRARRRRAHLEAGVPEAQLEQAPDLEVTVDDQYCASSRLLIRSRFHGACDARRPGIEYMRARDCAK